MSINEETFSVNVTAASGENYAGTFKVRRRLSHMQFLRADELRRELVGAKPEFAPEDVRKNAYILSTCAAHVISAPSWWTDNSNGVDLLDEEPVSAVFEQVEKIRDTVAKELQAKRQKSEEALKSA